MMWKVPGYSSPNRTQSSLYAQKAVLKRSPGAACCPYWLGVLSPRSRISDMPPQPHLLVGHALLTPLSQCGRRRCSWPCLPTGLSQKVSQIGLIPSSFQSFRRDSSSTVGILPQHIQGNMAKHGEVGRGKTFPDSALIFPERHIQHPMHRVFNAPMSSDGFSQSGDIRRQA